MALYFTGVLDASTALSGFGDPVVIFIATLFVVSEGLEASGVTAWAGQMLTQRAGTKRARLLAAVMVLAAVLSAFITPNGAAAALLPVTVVVARKASTSSVEDVDSLGLCRQRRRAADLERQPGQRDRRRGVPSAGGPGFGYFEFAIVGLPLVLCTTLLALVFGNRLLPERVSTTAARRLQRVPGHRRRSLRTRARDLPAPGASKSAAARHASRTASRSPTGSS